MQILLNNTQEWFIQIGNISQPIYHIDKPNFEFAKREVDRGGKKVLVADKKPTWKPVVIEAPLVLKDEFRHWVDNAGQKVSLEAFRVNKGVVIIHWYMEKAMVVSKNVRKGRRINNNVNFLVVEFTWSRYIK
jgi:hypothetical protein